MPRKAKQVISSEPIEETKPVEEVKETQPLPPNKDDYLRARALIKQYRENKKNQPKRKCSEKQLAALAAGRERNKRFAKKEEVK